MASGDLWASLVCVVVYQAGHVTFHVTNECGNDVIPFLIFLSHLRSDAFISPTCSNLLWSSLSFCYSFEAEPKDFV